MRRLLLFVLAVFYLSACSKDDGPVVPAPNEYVYPGDMAVYNVTYNENCTVFEQSELADVLEIADDFGYVRFSAASAKAKNLQEGDVIIIHGKALLKIISIEDQGEFIHANTEEAILTDAIKDGRIILNQTCDFSSAITPDVVIGGKVTPMEIQGNGDFKLKFKIGEYDYTIEFKMKGDSANVSMEIEKSVSDHVTAKFTAEGTMNKFYTENQIDVANSQTTNARMVQSGLKGDLTVGLTVAASGEDIFTEEFPIVLLQYPMMVGPIPVMLKVKVLFTVSLVVPLDGSSRVSAKFEYDSRTGFRYAGGEVNAEANIGPFKITKNLTETGASNAVGANFGLAFPRIEIGIFNKVVVPYAQTAFLIGGDYTFTPPCQMARAQFIGAIGCKLDFFGYFGATIKKTLWQEEKVLLKAGDCPE